MHGNLCFTFPYYRGSKKEYLCYFVPQGSSPEVHQQAMQDAIKIYEYNIQQESLGRLSKTQIQPMKQYTGTKTLQAEPMTKGEACDKHLLRESAIAEEQRDLPGYHVVYPDGYQSWSPAKAFDEAYRVSETALDRVNNEYQDLDVKGAKLQLFMEGETFKDLDVVSRALLCVQKASMDEYGMALALRQTKMESGEGGCCYLSFGQAITLLEKGFAVTRIGWNGKNLMVFKQVPAVIESNIIPKMQSLPDEAKRHVLNTTGHIDYTSQCLIFNPKSGRADSWVPSISDVFAKDWMLVE